MATILVTNDDGHESRALVPLARALEQLGEVRVVAPDRERSWVGKALTRFVPLTTRRVLDRGVEIVTVDGYPADCVQLGIHNLFDEPPDLVVAGINIGANHGQAFIAGSGTIGAAVEAAISGVPAIAVSAAGHGEWRQWSAWARTPDADPMWERLALVAADIVATVLDAGFPHEVDVIKAELPADAALDTPRKLTPAAPIRYGRLFEPAEPSRFHHRYTGTFREVGPMDDTDVAVVAAGAVAITPLRLDTTTGVNGDFRRLVER